MVLTPAQIVSRSRIDPVWFAEKILRLRRLPTDSPSENWALDSWQVELLEAAADVVRRRSGLPTVVNHDGKNMITVSAPQGPGKTFGIAGLMHWFGANFAPCGIQATAPTQDHIKTRLWGEFARISGRAEPGYLEHYGIEQGATTINWRHDANSLAVGEVGKRPENVQGFRRRFSLYLTDESTGIEEPIFPVLFGNMSGSELAILVMISNPTKNTGTFARSHRDEKFSEQFYRMRIRPEQSTRMKEDLRQRLLSYGGEQSPAYRIRWLGEFADADENQLIALQWIIDARTKGTLEDGSLPRMRLSVDVSDGGDDLTEITIGRHFNEGLDLLKQETMSPEAHVSHIQIADAVQRMWEGWGCDAKNGDAAIVDSIGSGSAVTGELIARNIPVIPFKGGAGSSDPDRWRNQRVQAYWNLRNAFMRGRIRFAEGFSDDWTALEAQLCSIRSNPGSEKLEDLVTKDEMKRKGIKSPDKADSIAMQFAASAPVYGRTVLNQGAVEVVRSTLMDGLIR